MNVLLSLLLFFSTITVFASGFLFPKVEYDYAKLYYFNCNLAADEQLDEYIFANNTYSSSKVGNGIDLSAETLEQIHSVFSKGVDELMMGLSKCYIPRHGIIYFDQENKPVASLSICFECEKIAFWSSIPLKLPQKETSQFDIDYAEKQMVRLKSILEGKNILISKQQESYSQFIHSDEGYMNEGEIVFELEDYDEKYYRKYTFSEVKKWQMTNSQYPLEEDVSVKYTAGGEEYRFKQLVGKNHSHTLFEFLGDSEDSQLYEAHIQDPAIQTPMGIQIGMSLDQLKNHIGLWDGLSNPSTVILRGKKMDVTYTIKNQTIVSIMILFEIT